MYIVYWILVTYNTPVSQSAILSSQKPAVYAATRNAKTKRLLLCRLSAGLSVSAKAKAVLLISVAAAAASTAVRHRSCTETVHCPRYSTNLKRVSTDQAHTHVHAVVISIAVLVLMLITGSDGVATSVLRLR